MAATTPKTVTITNVRPFQTIGLDFPAEVAYALGTTPKGTVVVTCKGANVTPLQEVLQVPPNTASGTLTFKVQHAAGEAGHTLGATLTQDGVVVASCSITDVTVAPTANPNIEGDLTIHYDGDLVAGLPAIKVNAALRGTYNPKVGDMVQLFVEVPKVIEGRVQPSKLIFADQAEVQAGKWKHTAVPNAKPGDRLVVVLTTGGVVRTLLQATFK